MICDHSKGNLSSELNEKKPHSFPMETCLEIRYTLSFQHITYIDRARGQGKYHFPTDFVIDL